MKIITATLDHLELVSPLFDAYRMFYQQPSDLEAARSFLRERFLLRESVIYLAQEEEEALGFTQLYPSFSSVSLKRLWILNDLFIVPKARGKRVGEALIGAAVDLARQSGATGVQLETAHSNLSGQKLYERMGFSREDLEYRTYFLKV
jgi:ribosomal protein S18 acetylase RimI-like enzyme